MHDLRAKPRSCQMKQIPDDGCLGWEEGERHEDVISALGEFRRPVQWFSKVSCYNQLHGEPQVTFLSDNERQRVCVSGSSDDKCHNDS